ncbi:MAG: hypothetical protein CFE21_04165 [Bacteroidetes bacterium B1(2017)]|nr:MAG: hypothetical protein CFE21_04165 [Bacteroidetes bacterium B1(2017)]
MKPILSLLFCIHFCSLLFAKAEPKQPAIRVGFVPNRGQFSAQFGSLEEANLFQYKSGSSTVILGATGFKYQLLKKEQELSLSSKLKVQEISIQFLGSNPHAQILELDKADGQLIYHSKESFAQSIEVAHYKQILYKNIYPNIDVQFLIAYDKKGQEQFKYNFILHPGAELSTIQLEVNGARKTRVNAAGSLCIKMPYGNLQERIPTSYELNQDGSKGKEFKAKYTKLSQNLFGFKTNETIANKTVLIDPVSWSTYFGGSVVDIGYGVVSDKSNSVYITGITTSSTSFASMGAYQFNYAGAYDAFLAKFSSNGAMLWTTYFGGSADERVTDILLDNSGNIVISGYTSSTSGISNGIALQPALAGLRDGFVAKFTPAGANVWATYYGFSGDEYFYGLAVDKDNDIYLCGKSNSTNNLSSGVQQATNAGAYDVLIMKMSSLGAHVLSTYFGGTLNDEAMSISIDKNKNFYICGEVTSTSGIATSGAYQATLGGQMDGFIARFDSTFNLKFATYFGGTLNDYCADLALDVEGKLVIAGYTYSTTNIATTGSYQATFGGSANDGFILRMDTLGAPLWATYAGGNGLDYVYGLVTDANSNIYITGSTSSTTNISTPGSYQETFGGASQDASLLKFNKSGSKVWGTYIGGTGGDLGFGLSSDGANAIYLIGQTLSADNIATAGVWQVARNGSTDAFLFKYSETVVGPTPISNNIVSPNQGVCLGNAAQTLTGTTPTGGDGMYNYQWLSSPTGLAGSFVPAFGTNANDSYIPGSLTVTTYYKRVVFSGTQTDTSNMISVLVSANLSAGFTVNKTIQCIKTNQFIFTDTTTSSAGTLSYWWDFGNGKTSTNKTDTVWYNAAVNNMYRVQLVTSLNGGCADTSVMNVFTISNPIAKSISGKDTVMKGTTEVYTVPSTNGSSYGWYYTNGTGRSTTNSISIHWTLQGNVQLAMLETNGGGCKGDTAYKSIYVKIPTSEEELFGSALTIYPNPSEGWLYIEGSEAKTLQVEVFDKIGKSVYIKTITNLEPLDLTSLEAGMYVLSISNEWGSSIHQKIQLFH